MQKFDDDTGKWLENISDEIIIIQKTINIISLDTTVKFKVWLDKESFTFVESREVLCQSKIIPLMLKKGVRIIDTAQHRIDILEYLINTESKAKILYRHDILGFKEMNGDLVFFGHNPIGNVSAKISSSEYYLPKMTKPKGTLEDWESAIKEYVINHPPLVLALMIGASSPVVHLLRCNEKLVNLPIYALIGKSSTGKTTAEKLMASIFGLPKEGAGIILDFNSTENALFHELGNRIGFPLLIDEATGCTNWKIQDSIYPFSQGKEKATLTSSRQKNTCAAFSGTIVITGETSLLSNDCLLGQKARAIELSFQWTKSSQHAEELTEAISENYGTAAEPYIRFLLDLYHCNPSEITETFESEYRYLSELTKAATGVQQRQLKALAAVFTAGRIFSEALELNFNFEAIYGLILDIFDDGTQEDISINWLHSIIDEVKKGTVKTFADCITYSHNGKVVAKIEELSGKSIIWISKSTIQAISIQVCAANADEHIKALYRQGLIYKDGGGHYSVKKRLNAKVAEQCYGFYLSSASDADSKPC